MPALEHPPDDIAGKVYIPSRYYPEVVSTHIYLAFAFLAILVVVCFLGTRWRTRRRPSPAPRVFDIKHKPSQLPLASTGEQGRQQFCSVFEIGGGRRQPRTDRSPGFVPLTVVSGQLRPLAKPLTMDGSEKRELWEDHYPWSALAASRGVSTSSPPPSRSPTGAASVTVTGRTGTSRSPRSSLRGSPAKRLSGISDEPSGQAFGGEGKGPIADSSCHNHGDGQRVGPDGLAGTTDGQLDGSHFHPSPFRETSFPGLDSTIPRHFSRPPPPPPLTPPTISGAFFPFENRRPSYAASIPPALDMSFIHQPNPEYGASSSSTNILSSSPQSATAFPRRRSYTKSVPIGIPVPTTTASASSSTETMTSGSTTNTFSPSSYPPTSPLLPPPPPGQFEPPSAPPEYEFVGGPGGPGVFLSQQEIDLQGEIISVMDDAGHGWKRHTRVYGGGVCLACVAAAGRDGVQGGFYGDKVPLEDRR